MRQLCNRGQPPSPAEDRADGLADGDCLRGRIVRPAIDEVQKRWPDVDDIWAGRFVWFVCLVLSFAMLPATWVYFSE